ncbi:Transient receptor potential channel [Dirofilaria immitis]
MLAIIIDATYQQRDNDTAAILAVKRQCPLRIHFYTETNTDSGCDCEIFGVNFAKRTMHYMRLPTDDIDAVTYATIEKFATTSAIADPAAIITATTATTTTTVITTVDATDVANGATITATTATDAGNEFELPHNDNKLKPTIKMKKESGNGVRHFHCNDWREMLALVNTSDKIPVNNYTTQAEKDVSPKCFTSGPSDVVATPASLTSTLHLRTRAASSTSLLQNNWVEQTFKKRECIKFIPSSRYPEKCGCGRLKRNHISNGQDSTSWNVLPPSRIQNVIRSDEEVEPEMTGCESEVGLSRRFARNSEKWTIRRHTALFPTDAYGTIEFQGAPHPYKAQYLRLTVESNPADIMDLFESVWNVPAPKLIITVHGGMTDFDLQPKLARVFRKGLLKAARTTGAWIITAGINAGVVRQVAAAVDGSGSVSRVRSKIVTIGIAPWGLLKKRDSLLGQDAVVPYHPHSFSPKGRFAVLNNRHSYFLLVDNGTIGRYGADVILRKRLESYISEKRKLGNGTRSVPVVCVVVEGGTCTIKAVYDCVCMSPRVPVVVCDGSGRAADLLAFAHQYVQEDGQLPEGVRPQLFNLVQFVFGYDVNAAEKLLEQLMMCVRQRHLITVFRLGEDQKQDVDHAILTALLKEQNLSPSDQLALALAWNRVDIARSDIFVLGQDWPKAALHNAMMEALINDRVDFVRLLLENGVSMGDFLTIGRLEELYNTDKGPPNTLFYVVRDVVKIRDGYRYRLPHIGLAIEKLMGNAYKSSYTTEPFRSKYVIYRNRLKKLRKQNQDSVRNSLASDGFATPLTNPDNLATDAVLAAYSGNRALSHHILWRSRRDNPASNFGLIGLPKSAAAQETAIDIENESLCSDTEKDVDDFKYPFNELLIWAVLTKRQEMALCMWQHGEEAMAKALVACRLYKSLAKEAAEDYLEVEICEELKNHAEDFRNLSLSLLEHCYNHDDAQTLQLLTYELISWGNETCLSLAVMVNNKQFLAHPCCQILLADLWHGGLRMRSHSNLKVLFGLFCPLTIFLLEFKSREELLLQPQTAAEHENDLNDSSSSSSSSGTDSSSESDFSSDDDLQDNEQDGERRRNSAESSHSINLAGSRRKRARPHLKDGGSMSNGGNVTSSHEITEIVNVSALAVAANAAVFNLPGSHARSSSISSVQSRISEQQQAGIASRKTPPKQNSISKKERVAHRETCVSLTNCVCGLMKGKNLQRKFDTSDHGNKAAPPSLCKMVTVAGQSVPHMRPIKFRRKLYEFYVAPITTFWAWAITFCVFMCCFAYTLLVRTLIKPTWLEWLVFAYVAAFGLEHLRKFVMSDPESLAQKAKYFFNNIWNLLTTLAIVTYLIGFGLRLDIKHESIRAAGRVVLACNSMLWSIKLLDFVSVHPRMGPYITMAGKMIQNMLYIIVLLFVSMLAFGLARQSITYPDESWHWLLLRNIFYKPYFMLYGEVYAGEIDTCGDKAWDEHSAKGITISDLYNGTRFDETCPYGYWVPPVLMTGFLLIANILLMSMLLAIFNNIFEKTDRVSKEIWLFQRYRQVMEYESTPFLPPPLTPLYYLWMIFKCIKIKRSCATNSKLAAKANSKLFDFALKLFLNADQVEKIHDFEEECMGDLAREKEYERNTSTEERIHRTADRTDLILIRLNDLTSKESILKTTVRDLDRRLEIIESRQHEMLDYMRQIVNAAPYFFPKVSHPGSSSFPLSSLQPGSPADECSRENSSGPADLTNLSKTDYLSRNERLQTERMGNCYRSPSKEDDNSFSYANPRKRTRTTTVTGCVEINAASKTDSVGFVRFGSLLSLDPTMLNRANDSSTIRKKSSCITDGVRRARRHAEYTSITDAIDLDESSQPDKSHFCDSDLSGQTHSGHHVENDDLVEDVDNIEPPYSGTITPTMTLRRAKESFLRHQNDIFKEYEEQVMVTGAGESAPVIESDVGDEMPSGLSDMGEESKTVLVDEEFTDSNKEYIEFCANRHSENDSLSSCAIIISDKLTSDAEAQSIHPVAESITLSPDKTEEFGEKCMWYWKQFYEPFRD